MSIRQASVYQLRGLPVAQMQQQYGLRVLVMRYWPRGVPRTWIDVWLRDAGPETPALAAYRAGTLSYEAFSEAYRLEQLQQERCRVVTYTPGGRFPQSYAGSSLAYLRLLEQRVGLVTVLCWESGPFCHRYLLQEMLTEAQEVCS